MRGLAPGVALPSSRLAHAGFENVSDGRVLEIPGPGARWESEFSVTEPASPIAGMESDLEHQMSAIQVEPAACAKVDAIKIFGSQAVAARGCARQVRRYAQPVGTGHSFIFQPCFLPTGCCLVKTVLEILAQLVRLRATALSLASSDLNGDSSSCSEAFDAAGIIVAPDESSNCNAASTVGDESVQFFVNYGKGSTVVRCNPGAMVSQMIELGSDGYAVCGTRFVKPNSTLLANRVGNGMTLHVLRRLGGGKSSNFDIAGQWQCKVCHATR